jgi:hypothetical protein
MMVPARIYLRKLVTINYHMKKISACLFLMVLLLSGTSFQLPSEWTPLLDKNAQQMGNLPKLLPQSGLQRCKPR